MTRLHPPEVLPPHKHYAAKKVWHSPEGRSIIWRSLVIRWLALAAENSIDAENIAPVVVIEFETVKARWRLALAAARGTVEQHPRDTSTIHAGSLSAQVTPWETDFHRGTNVYDRLASANSMSPLSEGRCQLLPRSAALAPRGPRARRAPHIPAS